jgi:hypothetical protein
MRLRDGSRTGAIGKERRAAMRQLPAGYHEVKKIDLMSNRKEAIWVNTLAILINGRYDALGSCSVRRSRLFAIGFHTIINPCCCSPQFFYTCCFTS